VPAQYEVSVSFVVKLMQRWRERGTLAPAPMGGRKPRPLAGHAERVRALVAAVLDLTIDGLRRHLADEGVTVECTLLAFGLTRRKGPRAPRRAAPNRADIAQARRAGLARQAQLNPERLIFIDGSEGPSRRWRDASRRDGASTDTAPTCGRGPRGERVEGVAPHGHWKTTTFIVALRHDGLTAPCVFDGAINGARFRAPPRSPHAVPSGLDRRACCRAMRNPGVWRQAAACASGNCRPGLGSRPGRSGALAKTSANAAAASAGGTKPRARAALNEGPDRPT